MHLIDTTMFFCARSGGVKRYLLAKRSWFKTHANGVIHTLLVPEPQRCQPGIYTCSCAALRLPDGYRMPLSIAKWCRVLCSLRPDLIEAADPYVPAWAAIKAASRLGVPVIAFYHSDMPRMLAQRVGGWITSIARTYLKRLYDGFDLVLAPSKVMHEHLLAAGIARVAHQPLGVDIEVFHPCRRIAALRSRLCIGNQTRLLVYAGRFASEKNIPTLLATAQCLGEPYHLLLIGGRKRARIGRNATVLPYQHSALRLATLIASCDVFLHAGAQETYGLVAAEAMACGLPVVAVASGAMPEMVDDAVGVCVRRANPQELAEAVVDVFDRDVAFIGAQARQRVEMQHGWDAVFRRLLHHYSHLTRSMPVSLAAAAAQMRRS